MSMIFRAPLRRRISRWLAGVMLLCALHPVLALGLAPARAAGDMVQICTGAGMVWVRAVVSDSADDATASQEAPSSELSGLAAAPCPLCAALAHFAPPGDEAPLLAAPPPPAAAPAADPACPRDAARVILDAPTRGPPLPSTSA